MYSELIHNFTENTEYSFNLDIDINTKNSDYEDRWYEINYLLHNNNIADAQSIVSKSNKDFQTNVS